MNTMANITPQHVAIAAETAAYKNYGNGLADAGNGNIDESDIENAQISTAAFKDGFNEGVKWLADNLGETETGGPISIKGVISLCNQTGSALSFAHELTLKTALPALVEKYAEGQRRWGKFAATKLKEQERCVHLLHQILRAGVSMEVANEINAYLSELEPVTDEEKEGIINEEKEVPNQGMPEDGSQTQESM